MIRHHQRSGRERSLKEELKGEQPPLPWRPTKFSFQINWKKKKHNSYEGNDICLMEGIEGDQHQFPKRRLQ